MSGNRGQGASDGVLPDAAKGKGKGLGKAGTAVTGVAAGGSAANDMSTPSAQTGVAAAPDPGVIQGLSMQTEVLLLVFLVLVVLLILQSD